MTRTRCWHQCRHCTRRRAGAGRAGEGDSATFHALLEPAVPLARGIFKAPTQFCKAGIAFLAWLNGWQSHFIMPAGFQSAREITHYAEVFRVAGRAGQLCDPELARTRMRQLLQLHGIG
ncbi:DUF993 family protein [Cribrihabitans neustonicus]|uniref:DUF993 family protein n=1 Tax=Cribrihabitans neustonicus TaxID=1429085 RepID=UPI003B5CBF17